MKVHLRILLFTIIASFQVDAQDYNENVTSGMVAHLGGDHEVAIAELELALQHQEALTSRNVGKANYYLHLAYVRVHSNVDKKENYPNALIRASQLLEKAINDPNFPRDLSGESEMLTAKHYLANLLISEGARADSSEEYQTSLLHFKAAARIRENHFLTHVMLGFIFLRFGDVFSSTSALEQSLVVFEYLYETGPDAEANQSSPQYDLDKIELSYIYQQLAMNYLEQDEPQKGVNILNTATNKISNYQDIKLTFAGQLVTASYPEEAAEIYASVYESDPNNFLAIYGLASYYVNKAAELSERKVRTESTAQIVALQEDIVALSKHAYPFVLKLHRFQPKAEEWLRQLVSLSFVLGKEAEAAGWESKLSALR